METTAYDYTISTVFEILRQLERNSVNLKTTASLNISDQMIDIESDHEEETVSVKVLTASGLKRFTVKEVNIMFISELINVNRSFLLE